MSKLGSFLRRLFAPFSSDNDRLSTAASIPNSQQSIPSIRLLSAISRPSTTAITTSSQFTTNTARSCSALPRRVTKQTTLSININKNENSNTNFLSLNTNKPMNRRCSVPLVIHSSTSHHHPSTTADQSSKEILVPPLHDRSLSSTTETPVCHVNNLDTNCCSINEPLQNNGHSSLLNLSSSNSTFSPSSLNHASLASSRFKSILVL